MEERGIAVLFGIGTLGLVVAVLVALATPAEQSITGQAIGVRAAPDGYASPHDPDDGDREIVTASIATGTNDFTATVTVDTSGGYVFETGYYLSRGGWNSFTFPNAEDSWVTDTATHAITDLLENHVLTGEEEFVVAVYSCRKVSDVWRCGCSTNDGTCDKWMLQSDDLGVSVTTGQYLEVTPVENSATEGEQFTVDILVKNGVDVYAYDFDIEYDATVLTFDSISYGDYLGTDGYPGNDVDPDFLCVDHTETSGTIENIACTHVGTDLSQGDGTLATLTFTAGTGISPAYSQIRISNADVAEWTDPNDDNDLTVVDYAVNNAYVVVQ